MMQPSMQRIFDGPESVTTKLTPEQVICLGADLAAHTTIVEIDNVIAYLERLKETDLESAWRILFKILDASGGFKSPLIRANNGDKVRAFLLETTQDFIDALEELDE